MSLFCLQLGGQLGRSLSIGWIGADDGNSEGMTARSTRYTNDQNTGLSR